MFFQACLLFLTGTLLKKHFGKMPCFFEKLLHKWQDGGVITSGGVAYASQKDRERHHKLAWKRE